MYGLIKNGKDKEIYVQSESDKNIVLKYRVVVEEIHVDKLEKQIKYIDDYINSIEVVNYSGNDENIKRLVDAENGGRADIKKSLEKEKEDLAKVKSVVEKVVNNAKEVNKSGDKL
jgi:hypothetical protein